MSNFVPPNVSVSLDELPGYSRQRAFEYAKFLRSPEGKEYRRDLLEKERQATKVAKGEWHND